MDPRPWLALNSVKGVGRVFFKRLIQRFGSPEDALGAPVSELMAVEGARGPVVQDIAGFNGWDEVDKELARAEKAGARIVTFGDPDYPANLREIHDPPPFLYVRGTLLPEDKVSLAMVGTRAASSQGRKLTFRMARELASRGITIVSGGARGIDTEAHGGAISAGGRTVSVLGCGIDVVYPPENAGLFERIAESGAVVTEYPLGTPPESCNFPPRNRIISGMTLGVVVMEAAGDSGSLITASYSMEQGRDVFAVPGSVMSANSRGTHSLIKKGAKLVECPRDILLELFPSIKGYMKELKGPLEGAPAPQLDPDERALFDCITAEPVHIDSLVGRAGMTTQKALSVLLNLELKGAVRQLGGMRFVKEA